MSGVKNLAYWQVGLAYLFVALVIWIARWRGLRREWQILLASVRMTLQLVAAGYLLTWIFRYPSPWVTLLAVLLMETFAVFTVYRKFKGRLNPRLKKAIALSLSCGTLACLSYFLFAVVGVAPWYDPQYFIPLAGMLVGNSMTGVSLGVNALLEGMTSKRALVEEALILGASPSRAAAGVVNFAFDSAILPTINSMVGMGIVFLPGMMTGQMLSGTPPLTAISYQICIMLGIFGSVGLSVILCLQLGYRSFFNQQAQLAEPDEAH